MAARTKKGRIVSIILFVLYLGALSYFLFFAENMGRTASNEYRYNLVPLKEIKRFIYYVDVVGPKAALFNIAGNVVAFLPFGFFLSQITKCRLGIFSTTLFSFEFSLLVEVIQLVTKTGSFDVDDLILNTLGGFLGYLVFYVLGCCRKAWYRGNRGVKQKKA